MVVLGVMGRNFAAGMSGGIAYVLDTAHTFASKVNKLNLDMLPTPSKLLLCVVLLKIRVIVIILDLKLLIVFFTIFTIFFLCLFASCLWTTNECWRNR